MDNDDILYGFSAIKMDFRGLYMSGAPMLMKNSIVNRGSVVEMDSQITQVFILNILRFEFPNILSLLCVAFATNLSVFSLMNDVCRIAL